MKSVFPSFSDSRRLARRNLAFPYYNWSMCLFLGMFHLIASWFLQSSSVYASGGSFMEHMALVPITWGSVLDYPLVIFQYIRHSPSVVLFNAVLFIGILLFTDTSTGKKKWNYIAGLAHAVLQVANFYMCIWGIAILNLAGLRLPINGLAQMLLFALIMVVIGGLLSGLIFGLYLLTSTLVFHSHPTEASSSFRHQGFKNFLRIHVSEKKLCIYPIGIKKVVSNWHRTGTSEKPQFEGDPIEFSLIEKEPIAIINRP